MNRQAIPDKLTAIGVMPILVFYHNQTGSFPIFAPIGFLSAHPERGVFASLVLRSVLASTPYRTKLTLMSWLIKSPGFNLELRFAIQASAFNWLNPLSVIFTLNSLTGKPARVMSGGFSGSIQVVNFGQGKAAPRTKLAPSVSNFTLKFIKNFFTLCANTLNSRYWLRHNIHLKKYSNTDIVPHFRGFRQFGGSGTTGKVALANRRNFILIDANPVYATELATERLNGTQIKMAS